MESARLDMHNYASELHNYASIRAGTAQIPGGGIPGRRSLAPVVVSAYDRERVQKFRRLANAVPRL